MGISEERRVIAVTLANRRVQEFARDILASIDQDDQAKAMSGFDRLEQVALGQELVFKPPQEHTHQWFAMGGIGKPPQYKCTKCGTTDTLSPTCYPQEA